MRSAIPRQIVLLALLLAVLCLPGCVRRRMTIRTNTPGAVVKIDHQEIGRTPVSTEFTFYGTRQVQIIKDGYETQTIMQPVKAPWYQYPPFDFITENLWPWKIRDERVYQYDLQPMRPITTEELLGRANQLRGDLQTGQVHYFAPTGAPAGTAAGQPLPPPQYTPPPPSIPQYGQAY